jgi:hypothetical protein
MPSAESHRRELRSDAPAPVEIDSGAKWDEMACQRLFSSVVRRGRGGRSMTGRFEQSLTRGITHRRIMTVAGIRLPEPVAGRSKITDNTPWHFDH